MPRLKRWESPRRQGRNDKGKGGSARQRQLKKQYQMLRRKLKSEQAEKPENQGKRPQSLPSFLGSFLTIKLSPSDHEGISSCH